MRQSTTKARAAAGAASMTGAVLEKTLAEGNFDQPTSRLVGMVKASTKQAHVSFAPSGCESWVDLPSAMIEDAEYVGHQTCKDHSHPVFQLSLKEPTDPQARVLLALLGGIHGHRPEAFDGLGGYVSGPATATQIEGFPAALDGMGEPDHFSPQSSARMADGFGGLGGLNAWRCRDYPCCVCLQYAWVTYGWPPKRAQVCVSKRCGTCRECTVTM